MPRIRSLSPNATGISSTLLNALQPARCRTCGSKNLPADCWVCNPTISPGRLRAAFERNRFTRRQIGWSDEPRCFCILLIINKLSMHFRRKVLAKWGATRGPRRGPTRYLSVQNSARLSANEDARQGIPGGVVFRRENWPGAGILCGQKRRNAAAE
jgi:hypothetical protein